MREEEIIERIKDLIHTCDIGIEKHGDYDDLFALDKKALQGLLDLYNKEKEKNIKLQTKNKELLRKLRNRVKEIKKLTKYSLYKKEFSRLNKLLNEEKEKNKVLELDLEEMTKSNEHKKEHWVHKAVLNSYISKDKIKKIIYPTPTNAIPIEIQASEWYKNIINLLEEDNK